MIRLRVLGPVELQGSDGRELSAVLAQPKRLALLAYLAAAAPRGFHRRDALLALFWPDLDQTHARLALNQAVRFLRRELSPVAVVSRGAEEVGVDPTALWCDAAAFRDSVDAGRHAEAIELYRNDLLEGFFADCGATFDEWLERERARLRTSAAKSARALAEAREREGDFTTAVASARRAVELSDLDERVVRELLELLDRLGDRAGAIHAYEAFSRRLASLYDVEPAAESQALIERIRARGAESRRQDKVPSPGPRAAAVTGAGAPSALEDRPALVTTRTRHVHRPARIAVAAAALGILAAVLTLGTTTLRGRERELVVGSTKQVTSAAGPEIHPAISPDGKMIAYAAGPGRLQIYVRPVAGGRAVMVSEPGEPCRWPRWSADGTRLTYLTASAMYSVSVLGGKRTLVVRYGQQQGPGEHVLSPSARRLAFVVYDDPGAYSRASVYVAAADGSNPRKIGTSAVRNSVHSLAWSPNERFIAYVTGNETFVSGSAIGNLAGSTIWVVPTAGGTPLPITDSVHLNTSPAWMPDGAHLLFVSTLGGGRDVYSLGLSPRGKPRGAPRRLTTGLNAHTISVSADGSLLTYAALLTGSNVWTLPIPQGRETTADSMRPVTTENQVIESISVSADGKRIAYDSNIEGNQDIYTVSVDGGEPQQLTEDPAGDFFPAWSPDGREIAFHSFRRGTRDVYVMLADGSGVQPVAATAAQEQVARWAADGRTLSYHGGDGTYVITRSGGPGTAWGPPRKVWPNVGHAHPRWSPVVDSFAIVPPEGLALLSRDGGSARVVARAIETGGTSAGVDWSPDGRTLYYSARDSEGTWGIWSVPTSGGIPRRLVHFTDPNRQLYRPHIGNDGRRFYFVIGTRESDVWVMQLVKRK